MVPVAIHGSMHVRQWRRLRFPQVTVSYGEPLVLARVLEPTRAQQLDAAARIFDQVRILYAELDV